MQTVITGRLPNVCRFFFSLLSALQLSITPVDRRQASIRPFWSSTDEIMCELPYVLRQSSGQPRGPTLAVVAAISPVSCHVRHIQSPSDRVVVCWIVNKDSSRSSLGSRTPHTTGRHSLCVVSNACSGLFAIVTSTPRAFLVF